MVGVTCVVGQGRVRAEAQTMASPPSPPPPPPGEEGDGAPEMFGLGARRRSAFARDASRSRSGRRGRLSPRGNIS